MAPATTAALAGPACDDRRSTQGWRRAAGAKTDMPEELAVLGSGGVLGSAMVGGEGWPARLRRKKDKKKHSPFVTTQVDL